MANPESLLFTWACTQCHKTGNEGRLTRKEAAADASDHLLLHVKEALERARSGETGKQKAGGVRVIPLPVSTNTEVV